MHDFFQWQLALFDNMTTLWNSHLLKRWRPCPLAYKNLLNFRILNLYISMTLRLIAKTLLTSIILQSYSLTLRQKRTLQWQADFFNISVDMLLEDNNIGIDKCQLEWHHWKNVGRLLVYDSRFKNTPLRSNTQYFHIHRKWSFDCLHFG